MIIRNRFTDEIEDAYLESCIPQMKPDVIESASDSLRSMSVDQMSSSFDRVLQYLRDNVGAILPRIASTTGKPVKYLKLEIERSISAARRMSIIADPAFYALPSCSVIYPDYQDPIASLIIPALFFLSNRIPVAVIPDRYAFIVPYLVYKAFSGSGLPNGSFSISDGDPSGDLPRGCPVVCYSTDRKPEMRDNSGSIYLDQGGQALAIVWKDADVDFAAQDLVNSMIERHSVFLRKIIVHEDIFEYFLNRMKELLSSIKAGDPSDVCTQLGPCASDLDLVRSLNIMAEARRSRSLMFSKGPEGNIITPSLINGDIIDFDDMIYTPVYIVQSANSMEYALAAAGKMDPVSLALYSSDSMLFRMLIHRTTSRYIGLNRYPDISYIPNVAFAKRDIFL
ncbi:hypothetical protein DMB44_01110 [Thermoplasma sp. Kam2015]|uniref:aldehyde dehydrogenase family protein n=1 Tax=Thermoplasma sp. Kam2015 TaxID=2094122 RepID=UPI000D82A006|nr:aldehyde dehydrogenase family protein [Thermoplasma sp. Kam2015]PYB68978.1 hypothetical protein DMB44_01110 [Thermoplasma sp. Kam2015]